MVYAGQYVSYIKYDQGALEPYLSWYPEYKSASSEQLYPTLYYHRDYWQYSSSGTVAGIGGRVDLNLQFLPREGARPKEIRRGICPAVWRFHGSLLAVFLLGLLLGLLAVLTVFLLLSLAGIALVLVVAVAHQDTSFRLLEYMA